MLGALSMAARRGTDIDEAARILDAGGVVAFPTETVYGLGADARAPAAVGRVYDIKRRPRDHPLIVHLAGVAQIDDWAVDISPTARILAAALWPGPLTIIVRRHPRLPDAATGGGASVGLRVPSHPMALALLQRFGGPIAAPSANRFGAVSPTTADHVAADLGDDVDYILDGGPCAVGVESTIVDTTSDPPSILRPGGATRAEIERVLGHPLAPPSENAPAAPGTLPSHYAPRAHVIACAPADVPYEIAYAEPTTAAVLARASDFAAWDLHPEVHRAVLPDDLAAAARVLYATLRELDDRGITVIVAALPDALGLGEAIADRLRRAAKEPSRS
jgi:L-threonylcarbamoyladenylate synthase